jgi:hypothetical protein
MAAKQKQDGKHPLYVVQRPDLEALKRQGQEYAHPRVQVGHRYGDNGVDYFWSEFMVEFQVSLKPDSDGELTNSGRAYGGSTELRLGQVAEAGKVLARVKAKTEALAPDQGDAFQAFIVGLRGCGYKEAVMTTDFSRIAFLR